MRKLIAPVAVLAVIGAAGLGLVKSSEGLRKQMYLDPVGIPTVCYGHTGRYAIPGVRYTEGECEAILHMDLEEHLKGVRACTFAPLNQNQQDAVLDFTFNVGVKRYCSSTLNRKINARDYRGAAEEFPKWVYAAGKPLPGLLTRRQAEKALFLTPVTVTGYGASLASLRVTTTLQP